jgi:hypothetical protein
MYDAFGAKRSTIFGAGMTAPSMVHSYSACLMSPGSHN